MSYKSAICAFRRSNNALKEPFFLHPRVTSNTSLTVPGRSILSGAVICLVLVLLLFISCTSPEPPKTRDSLMKEYSAFTDSINTVPAVSISCLPSVVIRWHGLESGVFEMISRDSLHDNENLLAIYQMSSFGEQINGKLIESIDHSHISFIDVLEIQQAIASACGLDVTVDLSEAIHFYEMLDEKPCNAEQLPLQGYLSILDKFQCSDFSDWEHVLHFLTEEDQYYRAFLPGFAYQDKEVARVMISKTEEVCGRIASSYKNDSLKNERLFSFMVMRTNRRLVLNAAYALENVLSDRCSSIEDAAGAVSSILSPFIYFNSSLLSLRTHEQQRELKRIAERVPDMFQRLKRQGYQIVSQPDSLPNHILKDYVAFVMNN